MADTQPVSPGHFDRFNFSNPTDDFDVVSASYVVGSHAGAIGGAPPHVATNDPVCMVLNATQMTCSSQIVDNTGGPNLHADYAYTAPAGATILSVSLGIIEECGPVVAGFGVVRLMDAAMNVTTDLVTNITIT